MNRLAARAASIHWQAVILMLIGGIQVVYAVALLWLSDRGIVADIQRDFGLPPQVLMLLLGFGAVHFIPAPQPRLMLLRGLSGQIAISGFAMWYFVQGRLPLVSLTGHVGLCLMCALLIVIASQDKMQPVPRWNARKWLMPLASAILLLYGIGLTWQPTIGIAGFVTASFSTIATTGLAFGFAVAARYILSDGNPAFVLFWAGIPQSILTGVALIYWTITPGLPLVGILSHLMLCVLMAFVTIAQVEEGGAWNS